jgi:hypothetical protein
MPQPQLYFCKTHRSYYYTKEEILEHHHMSHGSGTETEQNVLFKCTPVTAKQLAEGSKPKRALRKLVRALKPRPSP